MKFPQPSHWPDEARLRYRWLRHIQSRKLAAELDTLRLEVRLLSKLAAAPALCLLRLLCVLLFCFSAQAATPLIGPESAYTRGLKTNGTAAAWRSKLEVNIAVDVKSFGALGDGSTDDTSALQAAADYAATLPQSTWRLPQAFGYRTTNTVTIPPNVHVQMESPLLYFGSAAVPALVIGQAGTANFHRRFEIRVSRNVLSDWSSEASVGVRLINANTCDISIPLAEKFTIGVQCRGDGAGFAYNTILPGLISGNKIQLDLTSQNLGYCNQNTFLGGRLTVFSGQNNGVARYGLRVTAAPGDRSNNNVFVGTNFELDQADASPAEAIPILLERAECNRFTAIRDEGNSNPTARITNDSVDNLVELAYSNPSRRLDQDGDHVSNFLRFQRFGLFRDFAKPFFDSGPLSNTACYYDGSTSVHVPRLHIASSGSAGKFKALSAITPQAGHLEVSISRGLGVDIDTYRCKKFLVVKDTVASFGGRVAVRAYDAAGIILTNVGAVKGEIGISPVYDAGLFGGVFIHGSDTDDPFYMFGVSEAVKSITIILAAADASLRIRSFSLHSIEDLPPATTTGYEEIIPGVNIGTTPPSAGTWKAGRVVLNDAPTENNPIGWICTATGSPGTWHSIGRLPATITTGRVLYGAGTEVPSTDSLFYFDAATKRLGVGTGSPTQRIQAGLGAGLGFQVTPTEAINISTTNALGESALILGVNDGTNNRRAKLFLSDNGGRFGLDTTAGNGVPDFVIWRNGVQVFGLKLSDNSNTATFLKDILAGGPETFTTFTVAPDRRLQVAVAGANTEAAVVAYTEDGARNRRAKLFVNDASGKWGLDTAASSNVPDFALQRAGTDVLNIKMSDGSNDAYLSAKFRAKDFLLQQQSTPLNLSATDTGKVFDNGAASGQIVANLPIPEKGIWLGFIVRDVLGWKLQANTNTTIRFGSNVTTNGGFVDSTTLGDFIRLTGVSTNEWYATSVVGAGWAAH